MPQYLYLCKNCRHKTVIEHPMEEKPDDLKCQKCGGELKRTWDEPPGIEFNGSNFTR